MPHKERPSAHVGKRGEGINGNGNGSTSNITKASIPERVAVRQ